MFKFNSNPPIFNCLLPSFQELIHMRMESLSSKYFKHLRRNVESIDTNTMLWMLCSPIEQFKILLNFVPIYFAYLHLSALYFAK